MFTLSTPYAATPEMRNAVKRGNLITAARSAKNNLQLATEQLEALVQLLEATDEKASFAKTYTLAEVVGRNLAEVARLQARYAELSLEIMSVSSSFEVTR